PRGERPDFSSEPEAPEAPGAGAGSPAAGVAARAGSVSESALRAWMKRRLRELSARSRDQLVRHLLTSSSTDVGETGNHAPACGVDASASAGKPYALARDALRKRRGRRRTGSHLG